MHSRTAAPAEQAPSPAGAANPTNTTQSLRATVYYPFHPLHGQELHVTCRSRKGHRPVTVSDSEGRSLKIPSWMVSPQAALYEVSDHAAISARALLELLRLLHELLSTVAVASQSQQGTMPTAGKGPGKRGRSEATNIRRSRGSARRANDPSGRKGAAGAGRNHGQSDRRRGR